MSVNPWLAKAKDLDRYRWQVLRERHGRLGSGLRFLRQMVADLIFGLCARLALIRECEYSPCDFLLLQASPKVAALQRKRQLKKSLRKRGYRLIDITLDKPSVLLATRSFLAPPVAVPLRYFGYAAHAEWIVKRYSPRILLNDRNGSLYAPFLRLALQHSGGMLVHLAHATTVESSRRLGMNDYDYYFLFGQSSLAALQERKLRFGDSMALLTGSYLIDDSYDLPQADPIQKILLILGVGPDKEKEPGYQRTYALLRDWAIANPQFKVLIKAHPRSQATFWREASAGIPNLELLPPDCTLAEALARSSLVVNIMSNAMIEAALACRPLLYVNAGEDPDIFEQERFLGPCIHNLAELQRSVAAIEADYSAAITRAQALATYHLAHGSGGLDRTVQTLDDLLHGRPPSVECAPLSSTCGKGHT